MYISFVYFNKRYRISYYLNNTIVKTEISYLYFADQSDSIIKIYAFSSSKQTG